MSHHQRLVKPQDPYPGAEYLPIATLLLPVVGSTFHGSVAEWQRLLLLGFTLHHLIQLMRFPSGLIRASHAPLFPSESKITSTAKKALVELKIINFLSISILLASPFIALFLLRTLQFAMRPGDPLIDQFAIRLCFIAVALRPSSYLIKLFRPRRVPVSNRLSTAVEDLELRLENLNKTLNDHANSAATTTDLHQLSHEIKPPIRDLRRALNTLVLHRQAAVPATLEAQRILAQTTTNLVSRTQTLVNAVNEHAAAVARRQASLSAVLLARTNKLINATGTTLQHIGATLAPTPSTDPEY